MTAEIADILERLVSELLCMSIASEQGHTYASYSDDDQVRKEAAMALGYIKMMAGLEDLNDAVDRICLFYEKLGMTGISRDQVCGQANDYYHRYRVQIGIYEHYQDMCTHPVLSQNPKGIWEWMISNVRVEYSFTDTIEKSTESFVAMLV